MARLSSLKIQRFRNLENTEWRPVAGRQLLLGANGAGKTSLLEAIYTLATSRSFRSARLNRCCQRGAEGFFLGGLVEGSRAGRLELGWSSSGGLRREVDGRETSAGEYLETLPVVCWWAGQTAALTGEPRLRRRLLDQGIVGLNPSTLALRERFRAALAAKRGVITAGRREELAAWNDLFASSAHEIFRLRAEYAERLATALGEVLRESELSLPEVRLVYRPSPAGALGGERDLRAAIASRAEDELAAGRVLVGPQRDELELVWGGAGLRSGASAGEIKIFGLALTVARARVLEAAGRTPVLLLDDADAELDQGRLERAWSMLPASLQTVISSNRPEVWRGLSESAVWRLREGRVEGPENEI